MRCEYCDHSPSMPGASLTKTSFGMGDITYYKDIDRHLCIECAEVSFELAFDSSEEEEEWEEEVIEYRGKLDGF